MYLYIFVPNVHIYICLYMYTYVHLYQPCFKQLWIGHFSSVQFSRSVMSDSLWPCELQHARLPCPSPPPGACTNSCLSSWWCHPTISSSVVPFSSCIQSFPSSGSFPRSQFFTSGGQSIGVSALASVLPMNIQGWFPLGLTGLISLQSKGLSSRLQYHSSKTSILQQSSFLMAQLSHLYMTARETIALTRWTFVSKVMSLLMLSRFVIAFLPRSKCLLISWHSHHLQWFEARENKVSRCFLCFPIYFPWSWESEFLGRLIRRPGSWRWREGSGTLKEERGVWNSQEGGKDKCLFFLYIP